MEACGGLLVLSLGCAASRAPVAGVDGAGVAATGAGEAGAAGTIAAWWPLPSSPDRWFPSALLPLPDGSWAVADADQNRLFLLDAEGRVVARLPSPGRASVEWTALAAAPGLSFYALDGPGRAVHQYDLRGNYLGVAVDLDREAQTQGLGEIEPAGLAVDRSGLAVVSDRTGDRLLVFGPGWTYRGAWGQTGADPGSWRRPGAVVVGERPPFLVVDEGNARVVLVDEMGAVRGSRSWDDAPRGATALDGGGFAVALAGGVELLDRALVPVRTLSLTGAPGCREHAYATGALGAAGGWLLAGEGCSGRLAAYRISGD